MSVRTELRALVVLATAIPSALSATPPTWPIPEEIAAARAAHPMPTLDLHQMLPAGVPPRTPSTVTSPTTMNLEAIAHEGAALTTSAKPPGSSPALQIFITLEMPKASLERLVDQASQIGAQLVLRGLKAESLRQTLAAIRPLIEAHPVAWTIDPEAFVRFQVSVSPTFVLALSDDDVRATNTTCDHNERISPFVRIAGDVGLDYALETIARQRPETTSRVAPLLARLRGS